MNFSVKTSNPATLATPVIVLGLFDDGTLPPLSAEIDNTSRSALSRIAKAGDIKGKLGDVLLLQRIDGCKAQRILLIGLGKAKELDAKKYATAIRATVKALQQYQLANALVTLPALDVTDTNTERKAALLARLFVTAQYRYNTTKPKAGKPFQLEQITLLLEDSRERMPAQRGLATGTATGRGMNVARELGNLPANICTPTYLGKQALQLAKKSKLLTTQVLSEAQMKRLGMHSLLSVGNGSAQSSALIVMQYKGAAASERPHVIVGKGITFDTGGSSLKGGLGMDEMKFDMCGAASVLGAMEAIGHLQPAINVVALIPTCENMPDAAAVKPGDVVREDSPLVEMSTDKAVVEVPSPVTGQVVSITGNPGDVIAVGHRQHRHA